MQIQNLLLDVPSLWQTNSIILANKLIIQLFCQINSINLANSAKIPLFWQLNQIPHEIHLQIQLFCKWKSSKMSNQLYFT